MDASELHESKRWEIHGLATQRKLHAATNNGSEMKVFVDGKEIAKIAAHKKINVTENPVWIGNDGYQQHFNGIAGEQSWLHFQQTPPAKYTGKSQR